MRPTAVLRLLGLFFLLLLAGAGCRRADEAPARTRADGLPVLSITVFAAPSQSLWLPTLVQALQLDHKQGFHLEVVAKPGPIAYTDFATGADPVCYCAAPSAVARFVEQGSDITLLWNVFDLDYFVVTPREDIRSLKDLEGRELAADTSTGTWAISAWLLTQNGVDLSKVRLRSSSNYSASVAELSVGRIDALLAGMVNVASLTEGEQAGRYRVLGLDQARIWKRVDDSPGIPSIAFGVWRPWLQQPGNAELARKLYRANLEAAQWLRDHPVDAARIVSARTRMPEPALRSLFEQHPDMINIRPMSSYRGAVKALTQDLLPKAGILPRPLTDQELDAYVSDFQP